MFKSCNIISSLAAIVIVLSVTAVQAFVVPQQQQFLPQATHTRTIKQPLSSTRLHLNIGEQERTKLSRDTEPEDFFATNTDKMTDAEKIPIAVAGVAFITIPFIAGLIALYAAK